MIRKTLTLSLLCIALLSACGIPGPFGNDPLDGTDWELIAISKHRPIDGSHITISFEGGQASGSSGCNRYGGGYKVNGDEIIFDPMYMTEMACADRNLMDQELEYMQRLGNTQRFEILDGQLLLYWSDHEALTFASDSAP